jgi:phosphate transport system permease protein
VSAPVVTARPSPGPTRLAVRRRPVREVVFRSVLQLCLLMGVAFLVVLVAFVVVRGWGRLDLRLVNNFPSIRLPENAGARSAVLGTVWVVGLTAVFSLPIGVLTAIYLEEYADRTSRFGRVVELNIQNLAAVPSIVYGILGLGVIARGFGFGQTVLTASLTLSLLVLPIIIIASREALRAVPQSIRQASLALGATQWQTVSRQVLPPAIPGMATGAILGLSRAMGEAAPLLLLGGLSFVTFVPDGPMSPFTVMPIQIFGWTSQSREEFQVLASAAIVLLLVVLLAMNSAAIVLRNRFGKKW